jgi:hypothetical protein
VLYSLPRIAVPGDVSVLNAWRRYLNQLDWERHVGRLPLQPYPTPEESLIFLRTHPNFRTTGLTNKRIPRLVALLEEIVASRSQTRCPSCNGTGYV